MGLFVKLSRRLATGGAAFAALVESASRPGAARMGAFLVSIAWFVPTVVIKVHLIGTGVLTADIPYYENMLYNTGYSPSRGSFDVLYTWHDILSYGSTTFLTEHFSPTFALLGPIFQLYPHPIFLCVLQPLLLVIAGWGFHRLTRGLLTAHQAPPLFGLLPVMVQATYLCNYSNVSATIDTIYGFHHDSLILPLLIWGLVCVFEARWHTALVLFVLFLGMKENLPIIITPLLGLGLIFNLIVPRKKAALGLILCAAFFGGCYLFEFQTHNRHVSIIHKFFDGKEVYYAWLRLYKWTILRNYWLGFLAPMFALPALADLCLQLAGNTIELDWHSYPLMALAMVALVFGVVKASVWLRRWRLVLLAGYAALCGLVFGPMIAGGVAAEMAIARAAYRLPPLVDVAALADLTAGVPHEAKLSTTSDLLIFCADRRKLLWPQSVAYAEYVLVNTRTKEDNRRRSEDFLQTYTGDNLAGAHFYDEVNLVLLGYPYDESLYAYMDRIIAAGGATLIKSNGRLSLYHMNSPEPVPH
jgi:hypothetical protein